MGFSKVKLVGIFAAVGGLIAGFVELNFGSDATVTITVDEKERTRDDYLVWTDSDSSREVFSVSDSLFKGKFNSSDRYGNLEEGETYQCDVFGHRWPFLSEYRNLIECTPVSDLSLS